jgi:ketosteroid isomerase-like protein
VSPTVPPYEAVRNLLATYCELIDAGDLVGLGSLFSHAVLLGPDGEEIARGATDVTTFYQRLLHLYDGSTRTRHMLSVPIIHVDGDMATARTGYLVAQQLGEGRAEVIAGGRYRDTFACHDGEWRFAARQFFLDQTGDLSMHMVGR